MLVLPKRDRVAERREGVRQEILAAAWEIARDVGLTQVTLRDVAARVGMQAPSLYSHFASKNAIYDAMYASAWQEYEVAALARELTLDDHPRRAIKQVGHHFYDFAAADLARHQLMNQRIIPGFEPSSESYEPAVRVLEHGARMIRRSDQVSEDDFALFVALIAGLINQHHANDPGGTRYAGLLDRGVDMWADMVGLPPEEASTPRKARR